MDDNDFKDLKDILKKIDSESLKKYLDKKIKNANSDEALSIFIIMCIELQGKKYGLLPLSETFIKFYKEHDEVLDLESKNVFSNRIKNSGEIEAEIKKEKDKIKDLSEKNKKLEDEVNELDKLIAERKLIEDRLKIKEKHINASKNDRERIEKNIETINARINSTHEVPEDIPPELIGTEKENMIREYKKMLGACYISAKLFPDEYRSGDSEQDSRKILYEFILLKTFLEDKNLIVEDADVEDIENKYNKIKNEMEIASDNAKAFFNELVGGNNE